MNKNEKDLQEVNELSEVSETKEATVENTSEDKKDTKEKKVSKHHNAKAFFYVLGGFILLIAVFMILTGAWNPFKSNSVEEEALKVVEESTQKELDLFENIMEEGESIEDFHISNGGRYSPNGEIPNGFLVEENSESGCLKYTVAKSGNMIGLYNLEWETWYMKNTDYAKEKYNTLKNQGLIEAGKKHEYDIENGNVYTYTMHNGEVNCFVVRNGSVVYSMFAFVGVQNQPYDKAKAQRWFDDMGIDFTVQDFGK